MPRISKSDIHAALQRAADHIKQAAGDDGRVSRADIQGKLKELQGTERQLVDVFFRFIDHRDSAPGAVVTHKDVDRAIGYAKQQLIDQYDLNNNGLSQDEIARMSLTGRKAVELARQLKATATGPSEAELEVRAQRMRNTDYDEGWVNTTPAEYLSSIGATEQLPLVEKMNNQYLDDVVNFLNQTLERSASWGVELPEGLAGRTITREDLVNRYPPLMDFCDEYQIGFSLTPDILTYSEGDEQIGAAIQFQMQDDMALSTWTLYYDFAAERFTARAQFDGSAGMGDKFEMLPAG